MDRGCRVSIDMAATIVILHPEIVSRLNALEESLDYAKKMLTISKTMPLFTFCF